MPWLPDTQPDSEKSDMFNHFDAMRVCDRQTDRQTDGQTSGDSIVHAMHSIAQN